nr:Chain P, LCTPSRA peptide from Arylsulfatase A [synthetic construct]
LCTPSRA